MSPQDIIDDVISNMTPEEIPNEYIVMARVTLMDGSERILYGNDLYQFLDAPYRANEVRIILNVNKIRMRIINEVNSIYYAAIGRLFIDDEDES